MSWPAEATLLNLPPIQDQATMMYELWHEDAGRMFGCFSNRDDALNAVRQAVAKNGPRYLDAVALLSIDDREQVQTVAEGDALARLTGFAGLDARPPVLTM